LGNPSGFGNDRFALLRKPWLAGRSAIKEAKAQLILQRVDRVTDGGRGSPQTFCRRGKTSCFDRGQQHQNLIDARCSRTPHVKSHEKSFQFYPGFSGDREPLPCRRKGSHCDRTDARKKHAGGGNDRRQHPTEPALAPIHVPITKVPAIGSPLARQPKCNTKAKLKLKGEVHTDDKHR
jgi:hypothetical protein